ncbi:MAG TPA: serine hydrolase [Gemmatimonadales bacterium]|nr:serine hydrolase [Gemmatimonadales bacterium]
MNRAVAVVVLFVALRPLGAQQLVPDEVLQSTFTRWQAEHRLVGIAAGRLDGDRRSVVTSGALRVGSFDLVADSTEFEIGSLTKTFTATLLADMVIKGEVALDDPVAKYLPGWTVPAFGGREITLLDLATHTSALPRLPTNFQPHDAADPYVDYTEAALQAFLKNDTLTRAPGAQYEYSNLGMALLGVALAKRAGASYADLLRQRILDPLGMRDTKLTLTPLEEVRAAHGQSDPLTPVPDWHFDVMAPAGALHSTLADMLRYAAAVRDTTSGPLAKAMALAIRPRRPYSATDSVGLAWHHLHVNGHDVVWHNGETGGFHSWLGVDIAQRRAVVVLVNMSGSIDADGVALLEGGPLVDPPSADPPTEIALPGDSLSRLVGHYALNPQFVLDITRQGDTLFVQATGQSRLALSPVSPTEFFLKSVKAELLFQKDSSGTITGVVLRQNGVDQLARRTP